MYRLVAGRSEWSLFWIGKDCQETTVQLLLWWIWNLLEALVLHYLRFAELALTRERPSLNCIRKKIFKDNSKKHEADKRLL